MTSIAKKNELKKQTIIVDKCIATKGEERNKLHLGPTVTVQPELRNNFLPGGRIDMQRFTAVKEQRT